ncbi:MAG: hypothetical protein KA099_12875, partial [Alphaproteobacteria bacterium]|nr:hypothetical protein [Alphaproteobacteria bacterium]MBP7763524.1 hypothetical protein [Alphaproteobacteria bacterium]MBP7906203.1 hypothetical protein [Alphaproteobacteria bacterium]
RNTADKLLDDFLLNTFRKPAFSSDLNHLTNLDIFSYLCQPQKLNKHTVRLLLSRIGLLRKRIN